MIGTLMLLAYLVASPPPSQWPTLREALMKHGIEGAQAAGIDDIERPISSYAVGSDGAWFAIAYYLHEGEALTDLRLRTLDRATGKWRYAAFDPDARKGGSALRLARSGPWIYLDLHINPSAGELVVLTERLEVKRRLAGWSSLILGDGRVAYEHNMIHFAPFHAATVSLYDPRTDASVQLYPAGPKDPPHDAPQDRTIVTIRAAGATRFEIEVTEQDLRWTLTTPQTEPVGPQRRFTLTCDASSPAPHCARRPNPPLR